MTIQPRKKPTARHKKTNTTKEEISAKAPPVPATLHFRGDFANQLKVISSTHMGLRLAIGEVDGKGQTLIPFIEIGMAEGSKEEGDSEEIFSAVITLENAAYIFNNFADDFLTSCRQFSEIAGSSITPDNLRTRVVGFFVKKAVETLSECVTILQHIEETSASD